jgi:hypothetical protein
MYLTIANIKLFIISQFSGHFLDVVRSENCFSGRKCVVYPHG